MRFLPFLLAGLCLSAAPASAGHAPGVEVRLDDPKEELDELLDQTVMLDAHIGDDGSCIREGAVEEAKELYGDEDGFDENEVVQCVAAQCIGWPPQLFVSTRNCRKMLENAVSELVTLAAHPGRLPG